MPDQDKGFHHPNHVVIPYLPDDDGKIVYACRKGDCWFESDNLSDVAKHVVENQFQMTN